MLRTLKSISLGYALTFGLLCTNASAAIDIVANIEGEISGESNLSGYEDWIDILGTSLSASSSSTTFTSGTPRLSDLGFTKYVDSSSPVLLKHVANGDHFASARIEYLQSSGSGPTPVLIIELGKVMVTSYSVGGSGGEDRLTDSFTLNSETMKFTAVLYSNTGTESGERFAFWNLAANTTSSGGTGSGSVGSVGGGTNLDAPTISTINAISINEDTPQTVNFTVSDSQTVAGALTLSRSSTNPLLLPPANITFGGTGSNRTVTFTPVANQSGSSTVVIQVSDGSRTASSTFTVTVSPVNDKPAVTQTSPQVVDQDNSIAVPISISDLDTDVNSLTLSGVSSNTTLLPTNNIVFSGTGANRTATLTPASGQYGSTTVSISASDGGLTSDAMSFLLTVNADTGEAPTDILLSTSTIAENSANDSIVGNLSAVDADIGDTHSFSLLDDAGDRFKIGGVNSSQLLVADGSLLDFETNTSHSVMIQATDSNSNSFSKTLMVTITNVNDAPVAVIPLQSDVSPFRGPASFVGVNITDVDSGTNAITASFAVDKGLLQLDDSGILSGKVTDNFTGSISVTASANDINSVLTSGGLKFQSNFVGTAIVTITINVSDNGYSGPGGTQTAAASRQFNVSSPSAEWLVGTFTSAELQDNDVSGVDVDFDGDGLPTIAEYALGLDPKDGNDGRGKIVDEMMTIEGKTYQSLRFTRRTSLADPELSVIVEVATDDFSWNSGDGFTVIESVTPTEDPNFEEVKIRSAVPFKDEARKSQFMRIRFSLE